jgi:peptidylprolyl isomerase
VKLSQRLAHHRSHRAGAVLVAACLLTPATLVACGSSGSSSSSSTGVKGANTKVGVSVTGGFGEKPTLTIPSTPAPTALTTDVLKQGNGPTVAAGQSIVVNYLGQTWTPKDGKPYVFDNSYDKKTAAAFPIGVQGLIPGWNKTLVGQKAGTRVLLTVPPAEGYGTAKDPNQELAGQTLLFVVDVLGSYDKGATATGSPAGAVPAGLPQVKSASGAVPEVTSVKGVDTNVKAPKSALLLKGTGAPIDTGKSLVFQALQVDPKTGKAAGSSWTDQGPQAAAASNIVQLVTALKGANVGSRAVAVLPASGQQPASIVVVDIVGQY